MRLLPYLYLLLAICGDVFATASLKACGGFSKLEPTICALGGYLLVLVMLALTLKELPLGTTYAVWGGLGTLGAAIAGMILFKESYDLPRIIATILIMLGTIVMYACPHQEKVPDITLHPDSNSSTNL